MTTELKQAIITLNDKLQNTNHSLEDVTEIKISHQLGGMFDLYTSQGQNIGSRLYASINKETVIKAYPTLAEEINSLF